MLEAKVILWDNRFNNQLWRNDALTCVDGTNMDHPNYKPFWKGWFNHKTNGTGVAWEVALCIRTGHIVWINGPYPPGMYPDISIFRDALLSFLEQGERSEADDGYFAKALLGSIFTPKGNTRDEIDAEQRQLVRNFHETVNGRFKIWQCLEQECRHGVAKHSAMFRAVAVITQLTIEAGEPLFAVDYDQANYSTPEAFPLRLA